MLKGNDTEELYEVKGREGVIRLQDQVQRESQITRKKKKRTKVNKRLRENLLGLTNCHYFGQQVVNDVINIK